MLRTFKVLLILIASILGFSSVAQADHYSWSSYGAAWSSGKAGFVNDHHNDGYAVYGNFVATSTDGVQTLWNYSGEGTTVSATYKGTVLSTQICVSFWGPDQCSTWQ